MTATQSTPQTTPEQQPDETGPLRRRTDILLASFPRSGNTWVMDMLLRGGILTLSREAYRESVCHPEDLIPFSGLNRSAVEALAKRWDGSHLRVIKTHAFPRLRWKRAICLHRDGRDVVTSYFFYLKSKNQLPEAITFSEFLWKDPDLKRCWLPPVDSASDYAGRGPAGLWAQHVTFWRAAASFKRIHTTRYEDLLADPVGAMRAVFAYMSVERDDADIKRLVRETSFKKLRRTESASAEKAKDPNRRFYRSGTRGNWREHFSLEDVEPFKEQAGQTLIELGYEDNLRWTL
ncbi:MAG: sulfotransferase domain-containing protein [Phycisphaerales bacterium]|nr:sulfotransferase domain-containing protein [Phycisphaerales bacterium]